MAQAQQKPQPQAQPKPPVHKRRRRRRLRPQFIFTILFLTGILVGLMTLCYRIATNPAQPPQVTEPITTTVTEPTTEPVTTEPTTEAPTEPLTPMEELELFASEHDLTLADYPEKILELYERNEEAREYCMNYPLEYGKEHQIDISGYADYEGVPLFIQWDKQWGYKDYIGSVGGLSACGPTCLSMICLYYFQHAKYTPRYIADWATENRYYIEGSGTIMAIMSKGSKELGLKVESIAPNPSTMLKKLKEGNLIVCSMGPGIFTTGGHYILLVGEKDGKAIIHDPNSPSKTAQLWDINDFRDEIKNLWLYKPVK